MSAYAPNDGGLRAYLVALGGDTQDEYDADESDAYSVPPVYVIRFAYDDPPEPSDWAWDDEGDDDEDEDVCDVCGKAFDVCGCDDDDWDDDLIGREREARAQEALGYPDEPLSDEIWEGADEP